MIAFLNATARALLCFVVVAKQSDLRTKLAAKMTVGCCNFGLLFYGPRRFLLCVTIATRSILFFNFAHNFWVVLY